MLVAAVYLTHHFYNKHAWEHWDEVNAKAIEVYQLDRPNRFHSVLEEEDFFKDPFVKEYFKLTDSDDGVPLRQVQYMNLLGTGELAHNWGKNDIQEWIPGKKFETQKQAATHILTLLEPFEKYSIEFERLIYEKPSTDSNASFELTSDRWSGCELNKSMRLISLAKFFSSRAKLHILADRNDLAEKGLQSLMQVSEICSKSSYLVDILVQCALVAEIQNLVGFGIQHHAWSSEQLHSIQDFVYSSNIQTNFKGFPASEFIYNRGVVEAVREHGQAHVTAALLGQFQENVGDTFFSEDERSAIDLDKLIEESLILMVPDGYLTVTSAIAHEHFINNLKPELDREVSSETFERIMKKLPDLSWHEESAASTIRALSRQYGVLVRLVASQRMILLASALEIKYLDDGAYPPDLNGLEDVNETILTDPHNDGDFQYALKEDGASFELFSLGSSQTLHQLLEPDRSFNEDEEKFNFFTDTSL